MSLIDKHIAGKTEFNRLDLKHVYCNACDKTITITHHSTKRCITSHQKSVKHKQSLEKWKLAQRKQVQPSVLRMMPEPNGDFNRRIARWFAVCGLEWQKINHPETRSFLKDFTGFKVPDESTLRKYHLKPIAQRYVEEIRLILADKYIYVQLDEASIRDRMIVCVLVGNLDGEISRSYCINVVELKDPINGVSAQRCILDALAILWPDGIKYDRLKLLVTDMAAYFMYAGRTLKEGVLPDMLHITCKCHALHNVCEKIKVDKTRAARLVSALKNYFGHSNRRKRELSRQIKTNWPKEPIKSRWGSWINYCAFLSDYFVGIGTFILSNDDADAKDSSAKIEAQSLLKEEQTQIELSEVKALQSITSSITRMEKRNLTIFEQKQIIDDTMMSLPTRYREKLRESLGKNPDYERLFEISADDLTNRLLYAPLVSVDVERAFSQIKHILKDRRCRITEENLKYLAIVYYNENYKVSRA